MPSWIDSSVVRPRADARRSSAVVIGGPSGRSCCWPCCWRPCSGHIRPTPAGSSPQSRARDRHCPARLRSIPSCSRSACRAWVAALLVGAALAAAGASYQTLFRNPLGLARHPGRLGRRRLRRRARHPAVVAGFRHPGAGLRHRPDHRRASSTPSPVRCAARTRFWCWCWPASSSARWPAPASRW